MNDESDDHEVTRTEDEPHDRLTALCAEIAAPLDRPEHENVKAIIMVRESDGETVRNGMMVSGYADQAEAMADLYMHLRALFKADGKELKLMTDEGFLL